MGQDVALPLGVDPAALTRRLDDLHDRFVSTGTVDGLRPVVAESWQRSLASGLDPESSLAPIRLDENLLAEIREGHPLTAVMPVVRRLLVDSATEAGLLVAVSDAAGQLLYVEGSPSLRSRAEAMHFLPGADWSEAAVGTNAPGTALALGRPVQFLGPEHLSRQVTPWSCSAAPVRDPDTGALLGVLDVTGGPEVAAPHALSLVRATAAAAEAELRIARLSGAARSVLVPGTPLRGARLELLGRGHGVLTQQQSTARLSVRHSEILLLLASHRDGLSAAQLNVALSEDEQAAVTIRAEMSRMRSLVAPLGLESRPYRLVDAIALDLDEVRNALRTGRLRAAVAAYAGPVLPTSGAPAVVQIREDLHREVRATLLAGADADALLTFADTAHGRDDYAVWQRALDVLPASSPRRPQVEAHLATLDDQLA